MSTPQFTFHSAQAARTKSGIRDAVVALLDRFLRVAGQNAKYGDAAVVVDLLKPEGVGHFLVVLAGPFPDVESLKAAMNHASEKMIDQAVNLKR